jgi:protein-tyrosine-phosphatase
MGEVVLKKHFEEQRRGVDCNDDADALLTSSESHSLLSAATLAQDQICAADVVNTAEAVQSEAAGRSVQSRALRPVYVHSAGLIATDGRVASAHGAQAVCEAFGEPLLASHCSKRLLPREVEEADLLVCMEAWQADYLRRQTRAADGKLRLWNARKLEAGEAYGGQVHGRDVADPIGSSLHLYKETLAQLRESLPHLVDHIEALRRQRAV